MTTRRVFLTGLAGLGLVASGYLLYHHYILRFDPSHVSFCNYSERVNCDAVALHPSSEVMGIPVAALGLVYYFIMIYISTMRGHSGIRPALDAYQTVLAIMGFAISVYLFSVSWWIIESLCVVCAATYVVNLLLMITVTVHKPGWATSVRRVFHELQVK